MKNAILTGCVMMWVVFAMLCSVAEQQVVGSEEMTTMYQLLHPDIFGFFTGMGIFEWIGNLLNVISLWFNGTIWQGDWLWFYWIVCVPVSLGFVWELAQFAIWAIGNLAQVFRGVFGFFR